MGGLQNVIAVGGSYFGWVSYILFTAFGQLPSQSTYIARMLATALAETHRALLDGPHTHRPTSLPL